MYSLFFAYRQHWNSDSYFRLDVRRFKVIELKEKMQRRVIPSLSQSCIRPTGKIVLLFKFLTNKDRPWCFCTSGHTTYYMQYFTTLYPDLKASPKAGLSK